MSNLCAKSVICGRVRAETAPLKQKSFYLEGPHPKRHRSRFVYVIEDGSGLCKIGRSKNTWGRLATLQYANARALSLVHSCRVLVADANRIERGALRLMRPMRTRGEWFKAPWKLAVIAIKASEAEADLTRCFSLYAHFLALRSSSATPLQLEKGAEKLRDLAVEIEALCPDFLGNVEPFDRIFIPEFPFEGLATPVPTLSLTANA